jgi:hypothetical protein
MSREHEWLTATERKSDSHGSWFYMSFADPKLPKGTQFLGGCYVQAGSLSDAVTRSHILGINPGGEIKIWELPGPMIDELDEHVPEQDRHRLLSRTEIEG